MDSTQALFSKRLGKLTRKVFFVNQALTTSSNLVSFPQHDPPIKVVKTDVTCPFCVEHHIGVHHDESVLMNVGKS